MDINCPACNIKLVNVKGAWKCLQEKCVHFNKRQFGKVEEE